MRDPRAFPLRPAPRAAPFAAPVREPKLLLPHSSLHAPGDPAHSPSARSFFLFLLNLDSATFSPSRPNLLNCHCSASGPPLALFPSQPLPSDRPALARRASPSGASGTLAGRPTPFAPHEAREREPHLSLEVPRRTHSSSRRLLLVLAVCDVHCEHARVELLELSERAGAAVSDCLRIYERCSPRGEAPVATTSAATAAPRRPAGARTPVPSPPSACA